MGHVFVSYSRKDVETTDEIVRRLKEAGFEVWVDREAIKGGDLWRVDIVEAIDSADAFALMLSPNSAASDNVRKEVDLAEESSRRLFPVLLAVTTLPPKLRYQLAGIQWIDYGSDPEGKFKELVEVLKAHQRKLAEDKAPLTTKDAEVVIGGVDLAKFGAREQEKLLNYIAELTATPRAQLSLANLSAGSVRAFLRMPAHSAYVLKTAALNRDKSLIKYGITCVRLSGDKKYVMLETGQFGIPKPEPRPSPSWGTRLLVGGLAFAAVAAAVLVLFPVLNAAFTPSTATAPASASPIPKTSTEETITPTRSTLTPSPTGTEEPPTWTPTPTSTPTQTATRTPTVTPTPEPQAFYNFVKEAEFAFWNNCVDKSCDDSVKGGSITFGKPEPMENGFAIYQDMADYTYNNRYLEDGNFYESYLSTHPPYINAGGVRGFYDLRFIQIQPGDRFTAKVGFVEGAKGTDGVNYRVIFAPGSLVPGEPDSPNGYPHVVLGEHYHFYSGQLDEWTFTLPRNIAGQSGWFILEVDAGGSADYDWAVWLDATLERP